MVRAELQYYFEEGMILKLESPEKAPVWDRTSPLHYRPPTSSGENFVLTREVGSYSSGDVRIDNVGNKVSFGPPIIGMPEPMPELYTWYIKKRSTEHVLLVYWKNFGWKESDITVDLLADSSNPMDFIKYDDFVLEVELLEHKL